MPSQQQVHADGVRAELHVGDQALSYRRRGNGTPRLLLLPEALQAPWSSLEDALARNGRLLIPEMARWGSDPEGERVGRLLEGLGMGAADLVILHEPLADGTLALARRAPELVRRVVIVGGTVPGGMRRTWVETHWGSPCPMLLVDERVPAGEAIPAIERFLATPDDA